MPGTFAFSRLMSPADFWRNSQSLPIFGSTSVASTAGEDLPQLPNFGPRRLELPTLHLFDAAAARDPGAVATLIVAPYAVHDAAIADFAPGHSLARVLLDSGLTALSLVSWKSASEEMRDFGIDAYLADLNAAVNAIGGRASLVGLCQGGWLSALYAARFPPKVASLVLAGAPVDLKAADSGITRALALTPPAMIEGAVALCGGRVLGAVSLTTWLSGVDADYDAANALQIEPNADLRAKFEKWNGRVVNLPGRYFLETTEWLFRENRLAESRFPALGKICGLAEITAPVCVLTAEDDHLVALPQAAAALTRCVNAEVSVRVATGGHLSLFMGWRTVAEHWPEIAKWIRRHEVAPRIADAPSY